MRPPPILCRPRRAWKNIRHISSAHAHEHCDIVIVGGGPVGLALAAALNSSKAVRQNLRVALVEAGDLDKIRNWHLPLDKYSNRVSSLTNTSYTFLQDIGVWTYVQDERTSPIENMEVWDGISDARINFNSSEMATTSSSGMARLTENLNLQRGLLRLLDNAPDIDLIDQSKVTYINRESKTPGAWPVVNLDNGRSLRARLLVGADGFNSPVRAYAQIASFGWSYDTQGIVATLVHHPRTAYERPNTTAYQRFLPTGPIAFLPLSPTVSSLVWSMKTDIAKSLQSSDPSVLACMVNAAFRLPQLSLKYLYDLISEAQATGTPLTVEQILDEIAWREKSHAINPHSALSTSTSGASQPVGVPPTDSDLVPPLVTSIQTGTIASFPLRFNHTDSYLGEGSGARTVLIGDAAHTIHPLAGQGLNLGLGDVEVLARCIETAVLSGSDIGSYTVLQPYAREQYHTNHTMMGAVDKLHKLFSTELEPLVLARSAGLEVINELDSLKATIMMTAGADGSKLGVAWWKALANFQKDVREGLGEIASLAQVIGRGISGTNIIGDKQVQTWLKGMTGHRKA